MENLNFKFDYNIPKLTNEDLSIGFKGAQLSKRKRYPLIVHQKGDEFNQVFNFICIDSYMRPHLHPSDFMIEKMHLIKGSFELLFFDNKGTVVKKYLLDKPGQRVQVPAFQWHTYVMSSNQTIIFETMIGKYDPLTWKTMADWAPEEESDISKEYLQSLKYFKG
jgi:cupin fold WbuC family metalloprotein